MVSAVGHYVPPLFVFPRKHMNAELLEDAPNGSIGAANPREWIKTEIFEQWFDHFVNVVEPKARPQHLKGNAQIRSCVWSFMG